MANVIRPKDTEKEEKTDEGKVETIEIEDQVGSDGSQVEEIEDEDTILTVEDADPDEALWPDGPTAGQVVEWKKEFGDVFVTSLSMDKHLIWRTLNRKEYRVIVKYIESLNKSGELSGSEISMTQEELICETCILFPPMTSDDFVSELAGLPSIISQQVLESSGFVAFDSREL